MLRRRTYLQTVGVGAAGLVAGCNSGGDSPGTDATETQTRRDPSPGDTGPLGDQTAKLAPTDGDPDDVFGWHVALDEAGTTALVGAPSDDGPNGSVAGSAYVFTVDDGEWRQQAKLSADTAAPENDSFGSRVAFTADGRRAFVSAVYSEAGGSVYIFERAGGEWTQQATIEGSGGGPDAEFGSGLSVADDGSTVIVGAQSEPVLGRSGAGAAYVFGERDGEWARQGRLGSGESHENDQFGVSVAMSNDGTRALVGAVNEAEPNGEGAGAAYVFSAEDGGWTETAKLSAGDGDSGDDFGSAVALDETGTTAVVSATDDEDPHGRADDGKGAGSAYVFTDGGGWTQRAKLVPDDGDGGDWFGVGLSVSADGETAVVGAPLDDDPNGTAAGSAYVFTEAGGWSQATKLAAVDGDGDDRFGWTVALTDDGDRTVLGAVGDDDPNGNTADLESYAAGAAYVFD